MSRIIEALIAIFERILECVPPEAAEFIEKILEYLRGLLG